MSEQKMIPCPECDGGKQEHMDATGFVYTTRCALCLGTEAIFDRRAPSAAEAALRADVEALGKQLDTAHKITVKYIEEDNAGYLAATAEVERLQAELEKFTQPLTDEQAQEADNKCQLDLSEEWTCLAWDRAIRAAREGVR